MSTSTSAQALAANFDKVRAAVSDAYFMVEPAAAVIVSANSHLQTATGGAAFPRLELDTMTRFGDLAADALLEHSIRSREHIEVTTDSLTTDANVVGQPLATNGVRRR